MKVVVEQEHLQKEAKAKQNHLHKEAEVSCRHLDERVPDVYNFIDVRPPPEWASKRLNAINSSTTLCRGLLVTDVYWHLYQNANPRGVTLTVHRLPRVFTLRLAFPGMSASDSGSGQTKRGRGITRLADVTARRVDGQRRHVDIDPRLGQASGPNADRQDQNPCQQYTFTEEDWIQFRASRESEEWKGKRLAAQERQRLNDAPHLLSRGGYAKVEKKLRKSRADALGLESPDLAPALARYELWKAAGTKYDGNMTSSLAALISQRIDELVEQQTQGTFVGQGRDDILTTAIGRPEHPGRVRRVPGAIGLRDYFRPTQKTTQSMSQEALRQMDLQWEERLNQSMRSMEQQFMEKLQEQKEIQRVLEQKLHSMMQGNTVPGETPTPPRVNTRGSCFVVEPTQYNGQYELLVDGDPHALWLSDECLREGSLFMKLIFLGEAIGSFIAWPRALIMSHIATPQFTRPQKQPIHDKVIHEDDDMAEAEDDPLSKLMIRLPRLKRALFELYWDLRVFGLPLHVPVYITLPYALKVIGGDRMLNISIIQLWCM
ncbi:uncharacterized protein HKW66_Vig0127110 [Vigna angularis]|uniref:Transposase Tnp1/En/Spm-like domain-containing protein n=1 Tax=Phaseolus angularis TaxID=3914 RepID=A0A8T0K3I1_PHAAN|nr:uncharacterized protein HKW66_Vig0127110 [Vigna angularis]